MDFLFVVEETSGFVSILSNGLSIIRATLGVILAFFLPGFAWTLVFFTGRQITVLERLALSFGLSIALVTLSILALNLLFNVRITVINSVLTILAITIIPVVIYYARRYIRRRRGNIA